MTPGEMEQRLVALSDEYIRTRDPEVREEYRALHARWMAASGRHTLKAETTRRIRST